MDQTFFTSLLLALTVGSAAPSAHGFFEQVLGEWNFQSWELGGLHAAGNSNSGVGPDVCRGRCIFNFSVRPDSRGIWANADGAFVFADFSFMGPAIAAGATCEFAEIYGCSWETMWPTVPITMTGVVRWYNGNPAENREYRIAGAGTAWAFNRHLVPAGPWNYSQTRYEFEWSVVDAVPEPSGLGLAGVAFLVILMVGRRRAIKSAA